MTASVELVNYVSGARLRLSREAALDLVAGIDALETGRETQIGVRSLIELGLIGPAAEIPPAVQHWNERNWRPSLEYYLASRRWDFFDNGEDFERQRDEALSLFLQAEDPPSPVACTRPLGLDAARRSAATLGVGDVLRNRESVIAPPKRQLSQSIFNSLLSDGLAPVRFPLKRAESLDYYVNLGRVFDVYVAAYDVEALEQGVYFYDLNDDQIELRSPRSDLRETASRMLIGQPAPRTAACTIFVVVDYRRIQWVYRHDRVMRNAFINAGKIVQDLILVATAHGLKTMLTPAVDDSLACGLLSLDASRQQVLHTLTVG